MKNEKAITLISLAIAVTIMAILISVATYSGISVIESSKITALTIKMKALQMEVNDIYQKYVDGETITLDEDKTYTGNEILNIGDTTTSQINSRKNAIFRTLTSYEETGVDVSQKSSYKYWSKELISKLGIEGIDEDFFVNVKSRSIISYEGIKYNNQMCYTPQQLPDSLYNVKYENPNTGSPTFTISVQNIGTDKWKINISNIQYQTGYIKKWQVKYKKEGQGYWNTIDDSSFDVNVEGKYIVKLVNQNIESQERSVTIIKEEE